MTPSRLHVRQRYLGFLKKNQTATAEELARAFDVTPANARYHLAGLQSDGLVQVIESRRGLKRGRPVKVFSLSKATQGDNLSKLVDVLLAEWSGSLGADHMDDALERLARKVMVSDPFVTPGQISRRLVQAIEQLNQAHYQSRWEAHASGPRVIFESCPYASVIADHPELCIMDIKILKNAIGSDVEQIAKREKGGRNIPVCVFSVFE
jgi:predicted ArsR family transcriptional regulator